LAVFARLGDRQHERVLVNGRVAVSEFTRILHLHRQVRQFFEQVFAHEGRMPTGAAGDHDDTVDGSQLARGQVQAAQLGGGFVQIDAAAQRVSHRFRLLEDFLQHEMRERSPFGRFGAKFDLTDLDLRGIRAQVDHLEVVGRDRHHIVVIQVNNLSRVGEGGIGIAG
jgi:hypothetical protein